MNLAILDPILVAVVLLNFFLLGTGRLKACINAVSFQGILLGIAFGIAHPETQDDGEIAINFRTLALAAAMIAIKGLMMPRMMTYAMREAKVEWKIDPFVGLTASLLLGAIGTGLAMTLSMSLPLRDEHHSHLLVSASLSSVLTGFLLMTMRREALTQVIGFLVLENGIFIFGLLIVQAMPLLVEVGVLLDAFVGVFVMGIVINHVNRQFQSSTSDHLSTLKD